MSLFAIISFLASTCSRVAAEKTSNASFSYDASSSTCDNDVFDSVNATGSMQFNDLPSPDNQNHTWTISTAITELTYGPDAYPSNSTQLYQTWWLNTEPVIETNVTDLPYWGCFIVLDGFKETLVSDPPGGSDTCTGVLSDPCYSDLLDDIAWRAAVEAANNENTQDICQLITKVPFTNSCKKSRWASNATSGQYTFP